jgi:glutamine synthetase
MEQQDSVALDRLSDERRDPQDAEAVMEDIRLGKITTVVFGGCDLSGVFRAKRMPARILLGSPEPTIQFAEYLFAIDIEDQIQPEPEGYEGWWPSFDTGMSDLSAVADLRTLRPVPWLERTALVLCDFRRGDGSPYEWAPRSVLRRVLERYERLGLTPRLAPEMEFIVLRETEQSAIDKGFRELRPLSPKAFSFGAVQSTLDSHIIGKVVDGLEGLRVPVAAWSPEGAPGQYELNIEHSEALEAADRGFLFKHAVKEMCALEGLTATFMAKISATIPGSSMHVHQSLWREDESAFHDGAASDGMSPLLRQFIAGQLRTLIPFSPIWWPNPAAFKRPAPYMGVGTSENWGGDNRTLSLRVLTPSPKACRVEHRLPGADANVYLVLAGMLAGGLYGIENELELPAATSGRAYTQSGLKPLPSRLGDAVDLFEENPVANEYLGEEFVRRYAATRRWEEEQASKEITDWELSRYLIRA